MGCLLRETELCARIVQHHWRGVLFERNLHRREYDVGVRARLRSMHLIKFVELRHQLKVFRDTVGLHGLPDHAVQAYVRIIYCLVQTRQHDLGDQDTKATTAPGFVLANQKKVLSSGALAFLASLITEHQQPAVTAMIISIVREVAIGQGPEQIAEVLQNNIVERLHAEMARSVLRVSGDRRGDGEATDSSMLDAALELLHVLCDQMQRGHEQFQRQTPATTHLISAANAVHAEQAFMLERLKQAAVSFLIQPEIIEGLFRILEENGFRNDKRCVTVFSIMQSMVCSFGFPCVLDVLTRSGGRHLDKIVQCLQDPRLLVSGAALALFCELTDHPDGRSGLTTAGAIRSFMVWCRMGIENTKTPDVFVMGLIGCALLARQTPASKKVSQSWLLAAVETFEGRLDALYTLLLDLVIQDQGVESHSAEKAAMFLYSADALATLVRFITPVTPSCLEPALQTPIHRNISCIVLCRFFRAQQIAKTCFSEDVVNHLALSIQCNRLDEIEHKVSRYLPDKRLLHRLGSKEACKALSRLARCSSSDDGDVIEARLRPSLTSAQVPELPQGMICDVVVRLHVLQDLVAYIRPLNTAADDLDVEIGLISAAVELTGYLRPLPYGEAARQKFLRLFATHEHGKYAREKLLLLVEVAAPAILQLLRDKSLHPKLVEMCCASLSRLASTTEATCRLLAQGSLQTGLLHFPEFLLDGRDEAKTKTLVVDAETDDHGLLDVSASLYTLLGKLCAVSEGRAAIMRAQVLPRILKRLQLCDVANIEQDVACKSEIAVVISRLAMTNTVEGNTSELFLHFRVLDLLLALLKNRYEGGVALLSNADKVSSKKKLRVLEHVLGAIATLSQDILVCVPRVVELGMPRLLLPFLDRISANDFNPKTLRLEAIQFHAMRVVHSVAAYPFGEYHAYLTGISSTHESPSRVERDGDPTPASLMDKVQRLGYDFAKELQGRHALASPEDKTVGDLARETLAAVNENQQRREHDRKASQVVVGTVAMPPTSKHRGSGASPSKPPVRQQAAAFPLLSPSPSRKSSADNNNPLPPSTIARQTGCDLPIANLSALLSENGPTSPIVVVSPGSPNPVRLNGVDLAMTRPPGKSDSPQRRQEERQQAESPRYVFAVPRRQKKVSDATSSLMLDPLFGSTSADKLPARLPRNSIPNGLADLECHSFSQETERFGHCVSVKARRARRGDRYIPSLGVISAPGLAQQ